MMPATFYEPLLLYGCDISFGCFFFNQEDWLDVPNNWSSSIVQEKSYDTNESVGGELWKRVELLLNKYLDDTREGEKSQLILEDTEMPRYGNSILRKVRLGQGAFEFWLVMLIIKDVQLLAKKHYHY